MNNRKEQTAVSLSASSSAHISPKAQARRHLTEAITAYLEVSRELAAATERATETSGSTDSAARRRAYRTLSELGDQVRLAQRRLGNASRQARRVLSVVEIEDVAKRLDQRETTESAAILVKAALAG